MGHSGSGIRRRWNGTDDFRPHVHFEVKYNGVLASWANDESCDSQCWGYSPKNPAFYGWLNPWTFVERAVQPYLGAVDSDNQTPIVSEPGGSEVIGTLAHGSPLVAFGASDGWYLVSVPHVRGPAVGWVEAHPADPANLMEVQVEGGNSANVRKQPKGSGVPMGVKVWNRQLLVASSETTGSAEPGCQGGWRIVSVSVSSEGNSGWVCSDFLRGLAAGPPTSPDSLEVRAISTSQIAATWADRSSDETEFRVLRRTDAAGVWTVVARPPTDSTSFMDSGLTSGQLYFYKVRACRSQSCSGFSNEASARTSGTGKVPAAPKNPTATADKNGVLLTWRDMTGVEDRFEIERRLAQGEWKGLTSVPRNVESFLDSQVAAGTRYAYRVRACNGAGCSTYSPEVGVWTPQTVVPAIRDVAPKPLPGSSSAQTLTIYGSNFVSGATVRLKDLTNGGTYTKSTNYTNSGQLSISAIFTNNTATWSVQVINPNGDSSNVFTVQVQATSAPPPSISGVLPGSYPGSGVNQPMTITGSNFQNGATLTFDPPTGSNINSTASKLTFVSSSQLTYLFTPANDAGTWTVRVNNPDGQSFERLRLHGDWNLTCAFDQRRVARVLPGLRRQPADDDHG